MLIETNLTRSSSRFDWVLRGEKRGPDHLFDEDLADYQEAAVIPTRGAIVPEWLLIVPRMPFLSLAQLTASARVRMLEVADEVSKVVCAGAGATVVFEHGASRRGTPAGCGVDQAHLHVVGGPTNFFESLIDQVDEVTWSSVNAADPWCDLPDGADYLIVRGSGKAMRALVASPSSQRLRRAVSAVFNCQDKWDYRSNPCEINAIRTKEMFRGAFVGADGHAKIT